MASWMSRPLAVMMVVLVVAVVHGATPLNPGFKSTVSLDGLSYMKDVGLAILVSELPNIHVPTIVGDFLTNQVGMVTYTISNIAWSSFDVRNSSITFIPTASVRIMALDVSAHVSLDWLVMMKNWPNFQDSGSVTLTVSKVLINITASGGSQKGRPTASVSHCQVSIGFADITFSGPSSWLYNLLMEEIASNIRSEMETNLASLISNGINYTANAALGSLPIVEKIDGHVEIDYHVICPPTVTEGFFTFNHKGEFFRIANPENSPYSPSLLPNNATEQMVQMFISDYTANSVAFSYFTDGALTVTIPDSMLPPDAPLRLNTTYFAELIPPLNATYPGELMTLVVYAIAAPKFQFSPKGAAVTAIGNVDVYVEPDNILVFTLTIEIECTGTAGMSGMSLNGELYFLNASIDLSYTSIGYFDPSVLQDAINALLRIGVIPMINSELKKGFVLPTIPGLTFQNSTIGWGKDYLYVSTSINYSPPFVPHKR